MSDKQETYQVASEMAHGYYLASLSLCAGDPILSEGARAFYQQLGLESKYSQRFDGVSVFTRGADLIIRVCLQNFFCEQLDVRVHDCPQTHKIADCACGGEVYLQEPDGDFLTVRLRQGIFYTAIPKHLWIPKCTLCKEVFLGYSQARDIALLMGGELAE